MYVVRGNKIKKYKGIFERSENMPTIRRYSLLSYLFFVAQFVVSTYNSIARKLYV